MSILINGMEMPKNCGSCPLRRSNENRVWCYKTGEYIDFNKEFDGRKNNCPLIEVPTPHGRLGDLDALVKDLAVYRGGHNEGYGFDGGMYEAYNNSIELVEEAPTVIEAED